MYNQIGPESPLWPPSPWHLSITHASVNAAAAQILKKRQSMLLSSRANSTSSPTPISSETKSEPAMTPLVTPAVAFVYPTISDYCDFLSQSTGFTLATNVLTPSPIISRVLPVRIEIVHMVKEWVKEAPLSQNLKACRWNVYFGTDIVPRLSTPLFTIVNRLSVVTNSWLPESKAEIHTTHAVSTPTTKSSSISGSSSASSPYDVWTCPKCKFVNVIVGGTARGNKINICEFCHCSGPSEPCCPVCADDPNDPCILCSTL